MPKCSPVVVSIERVDNKAFGISQLGDLELRIAGAAAGDIVTVNIEHKSPHRSLAWGSVSSVQGQRKGVLYARMPSCLARQGRCGGCPAAHLKSDVQHKMKQKCVTEALKKEGISAEVRWFSSPLTKGYRNRGQFVSALDIHGSLFLGSPTRREVMMSSLWTNAGYFVVP